MPVEQQKSTFALKMGNRLDSVIKAHATDETDYGFTRLPPGINNGVAQLTKCYFAEHPAGHKHAGKHYFRAEGTVVSPEYVDVNGVPVKVAGQTTSIIIGCYDITGSGNPPKVTPQAEQIADVMNEMRKLGADTSTITSAAGLEAMATGLAKTMPYFRFSTSLRKARTPQETDGTWENWNGIKGVEEFAASQGDHALAGATDASSAPAPAPSANGATRPVAAKPASASPKPVAAKPTAPAPAAKPVAPAVKAPKPAPVPPPPPEPEPEPVAEEETALDPDQGDITTLVELANNKNAAAQKQLKAMALAAGVEEGVVDAAETWQDVANLIVPTSEEAAGEEVEEAGDVFLPKVTEVYGYCPVDKSGNKMKKVEVQVTAVNEEKQTVDLKNMENKKSIYKGIPFGDLESAD